MNEKPNLLTILDVAAGLMILTAAGLVFFYVPVEVMMGSVQKVFYFHVATAWVGMLGFLVAAIAGVVYLRKGNLLWDIAGNSAVEISLIFFLTAIVLGSIWARPIWNTWWTWEPRLTTAAIVELIYAAYLLLRQGVDDPERRARFSAIYAIFGFFSVPLTFISIRLLRTIHPVVIGSAEAASQGGNCRVGLEDNLYINKGEFASNLQLVERAVRVIREIGREPATPTQAAQRLGIKR